MHPRYTPYSIIKERQHQLIATVLVVALILSTTYYLFTSNQASATTTHTWDDAVTLDRTTQTDTTKSDFEAGYSLPSNKFNKARVVEETDGEVILNYQEWTYTLDTNPGLASLSVDSSFLDNNLLYVSTAGGGLSVINTQGTQDPNDDTLVTRYHTGSSPALADDWVTHSFIDNDLLYLSTYGGGLSVINTQGTTDPNDDTLVTRYHTGSSPALANNNVNHSFLDNGLLYVSTFSGLSVINTQGTTDPNDDTLVTRYYTGSSPALANNNVNHSFLDNSLLYISTTYGGLSVINIGSTTDPNDDTLVTRYYTGSTPALASSDIYHSFIDNDLLYLSTYGGGLSVINTQGTQDPNDDTLFTRYHTSSTPALVNNNVLYSFLDNNLLYISTYGGGLSVIDIGIPENSSDDTLVTRYHYDSNPALADNAIYHAFLDNNLLYVSTAGGGLSVISTAEEYGFPATFLGLPQSLNTVPTTSLSLESEVTTDHIVSLAYRTGTTDAVWRDNFDNLGSYAADLYGWGQSIFSTASVENGVFALSDPPEDSSATFWFDTGLPADHFPAGSVITARIRANSNDPERAYESWMFFDDWDNEVEFNITNEWGIVTLVADSPFSTIGFQTYFSDNLDYYPSDTFQIDYISITTPDSAGEWNDWSTDCTDAVCPINPDELTGNEWIQYRLDLATDNPLTTPKVLSVTYNGPYINDTYTSTTETFANTQNLLTFDVTADTPADTSITYEYSTDNASTWTPVTPGANINQTANNFTWRATLGTANPAVTPTITLVTLSTTNYTPPTSTSISKRIASLEAEGKLDAATALRQKYSDLFTTRTTADIQKEIILKAREVITLLEQMIRIKEEE